MRENHRIVLDPMAEILVAFPLNSSAAQFDNGRTTMTLQLVFMDTQDALLLMKFIEDGVLAIADGNKVHYEKVEEAKVIGPDIWEAEGLIPGRKS